MTDKIITNDREMSREEYEAKEHKLRKLFRQKYAKVETDKINVQSETVNIQINDYDGNKTKFIGLNSEESIKGLQDFLAKRLEEIQK